MTLKDTSDSQSNTKRLLRHLGRGSKGNKLVYLSDHLVKESKAERVFWRVFYWALLIGFLIAVAVLSSGCANYSGRLPSGPYLYAANCGTAESDEECVAQVERIRALTAQAYFRKTGVTFPPEGWALLDEIYIDLYPVFCPTPEDSERRCSGILIEEYDGHFTIHAQNARCLAWTSLSHEFVHYMNRLVTGVADPEHKRRDLFYADDSVERRSQAATQAEGFCDKVYDVLSVGGNE